VIVARGDSIKVGMRMLYDHAGLVVEPSAALGVAAILEEPERFAGRRVTTILCGSNVGHADFARWVLEPDAR
jgi:threonine dehydratase